MCKLNSPRDLTIFTISLISSCETINIFIPNKKSSLAGVAAVNLNSIKALSANGLNTN